LQATWKAKESVVELDELAGTKATMVSWDDAAKGHNRTSDEKQLSSRYMFVIAASSNDSGVDASSSCEQAGTKEVGIQCLEQLHKQKHKQDVNIFMVNLAVHKETAVKQVMEQWKRECLWKMPS